MNNQLDVEQTLKTAIECGWLTREVVRDDRNSLSGLAGRVCWFIHQNILEPAETAEFVDPVEDVKRTTADAAETVGNALENTPAAADAPNGSAQGDNASGREAKIAELNPADRKAYFAFELAQQKAGRQLADREAYDDLKERGLPSDAGELSDYVLPSFDTWTRYLRGARNALGEQKYTPRANRPTGRSIVSADEIERQNPES